MLTQTEADALIAVGKRFVSPVTISLAPGQSQMRELIGDENQERFLLDLWRGTLLHLYREGYEDKWAYALKPSEFSNPREIVRTFEDFCRFCNIRDVPPFQEGLL